MVKFGHTHYANFPRSKCPVEPHLYQVIKASEPGGGGGGGGVGTWVNFCLVCAAGLSEPLPHYSLLCDQL